MTDVDKREDHFGGNFDDVILNISDETHSLRTVKHDWIYSKHFLFAYSNI